MSYLRWHSIKVFIETRTHLGDYYYNAAKRRLVRCENVKLYQGDSGKLIIEIVSKLQSPALFWLDGHYSGGVTALGELETPVNAELQAILASPITGHVILIDDVRCFDGTHDYPHLDEFMAVIRADGRYHTEVSTDILRLTPRTD